MKLLKEFSTIKDSITIDESGHNILAIVNKIAKNTQRLGLRVSVAELIELSRLLTIYAELKEGLLTKDDILFVTCSVLCKRPEDRKKIIKAIDSILNSDSEKNITSIRDILHGIRSDLERLSATPGSKIHVHSSNEEVQAAYARLQLLGIIRGKGRTKYILSERLIRKIAKQLANESYNYREAVANSIMKRRKSDLTLSLAARLGTELPHYLDLGKLGIRELIKIYRYAKSRPLKRYIAHTIARKLDSFDDELSSTEARLLWDILSREKMLRQELISKLIAFDSRLVDSAKKKISREELLDIALNNKIYKEKTRIEIVTKLLGIPPSRKSAIKAFFVNKSLFEKVKRGKIGEEALTALSKIMEARELLLKSLVNGGENAYQDYAVSELEKARELITLIKNEEILNETKKLYERVFYEVSMALAGNSYAVLKSIVKDLSVTEAVKILNEVANSPNPRIRSQALRLLYIIVRRQVGFSSHGRRSYKDIDSGYGRISTRHTLLNLIRLKARPISVLKYRKLKRLILVVDKSGSMRDYAIATLLSASALTPLVKRIVFFDENVYIINNLSRLSIQRIIELVLSTQFSGYTNILSALREATKKTSISKLVLVSDLEQTIRPYSGEDVCEYMKNLRNLGWNIIILTPSRRYPKCFDEINVRIHVISNVNNIRRVLSRI